LSDAALRAALAQDARRARLLWALLAGLIALFAVSILVGRYPQPGVWPRCS